MPGLWRRGSIYYAQLRIDLGNGHTAPRRLALDALTLDDAKIELGKKRADRDRGKLPVPQHRPKLEDFGAEYLESAKHTKKKPSTQRSEKQALKRWKKHIGGVRLDRITLPMIHSYREQRLQDGTSERTVNLDTMALRQVLAFAKQRGLIDNLVQFFDPKRGGGLEPLRQRPAPQRPLLKKEEFRLLLECADEKTTKNSLLFRLYVRFLALTGAREQEALKVRRSEDVDLDLGRVRIGAGGVAKNSKERWVDSSPELAALIQEIEQALPPDTSWLFPSPQRGAKDIHAKTLRESLKAARKKAALDWMGFHDLRHFFASQCVMAGIDFMTISQWLGHSDGGILVGKVYGHLADTHKRAAAQKLRFFDAV
ncbi:MAG: tyrosine-type recombinase/integrase [Chthoniobacterales bacterium]